MIVLGQCAVSNDVRSPPHEQPTGFQNGNMKDLKAGAGFLLSFPKTDIRLDTSFLGRAVLETTYTEYIESD